MAKQNLSAPGLIDTNGKARAPLAVEGDVHCWNLDAPGMRVEMHSAAVFRISHDMRREAAPHEWPAGLLLGKVDKLDTGMLRFKITNVEPCDFRELDSTLLNSTLILGYYRITGEEEFAFTDLDLTLARWRFPHPNRLFLLVRASG